MEGNSDSASLSKDLKPSTHKETFILIVSTFIAGLCSIIYELLISTASSYFLGDSIRQFSITIGLYMAAMGVGSFISRAISGNLLSKFIAIEILLGFLGGMSIPILYATYAYTDAYYPVMIVLILSIGTLIGLEIPLLTRIMESYFTLKFNISNILSVDYLGALAATLMFPFILLPALGTFKSALFFGVVNMGIGVLNLWCFADKLEKPKRRAYTIAVAGVLTLLITFFFVAHVFIKHWSNAFYDDQIIYSHQSPFQRIVMTRNKKDVRLFLNGHLQFSSLDEYRYHEPLVHIPMSMVPHRQHVLILGGGDGLAVRELLKYPDVQTITLVDLDPMVVDLAIHDRHIRALNQGSLKNPKVSVVHSDAYEYLENHQQYYDVIIADLPDPNHVNLARFYSKEFYQLVKSRLAKTGVFVTQATSPFFAKQAFWCIHATLLAAGFSQALPYHAYVPSFGDWGFLVASHIHLNPEKMTLNVPTRFLETQGIPSLFVFEKDLRVQQSEPSTLDDPVVLSLYLKGWNHWK